MWKKRVRAKCSGMEPVLFKYTRKMEPYFLAKVLLCLSWLAGWSCVLSAKSLLNYGDPMN